MIIHPVIMAGGSGTRLWPLSRAGYPKQFSPLLGEVSLFQATVRRLSGPGFAPPLAITGGDFRFVVTEQLAATGVADPTVLIEPAPRNTAPAVLAAALWIAAGGDPGALMLVAPSDHAIPDAAAFRAAVARARPAAEAGRIVTFGITPDRPETGYGYIETESALPDPGLPDPGPPDPGPPDPGPPDPGPPDPGLPDPVLPVRRFVEKPDAARAAEMLAAGRYLWNAGIFLMRADVITAAFEDHAPDMLPPARAAVAGAAPDLGFHRLAEAPWQGMRDISIDHAIMEKAGNISVLPYEDGWSDLGDWDAVAREALTAAGAAGAAGAPGAPAIPGARSGPDAGENALSGAVTALDCSDTLLRSDPEGPQVVGLGLTDMLVVATPDAVLVAPRARAQEVRRAVTALRDKGAPEATAFPWEERPWGRFETLALGPRFQVKRIVVKPGGVLSLQSHVHRAEHWVVVEGTARVTIGEEVRLVGENQSVYVPLGAVHRLENPGRVPMVLIEVQTGSYLGEDDIHRYEDVYARGQGAKG